MTNFHVMLSPRIAGSYCLFFCEYLQYALGNINQGLSTY